MADWWPVLVMAGVALGCGLVAIALVVMFAVLRLSSWLSRESEGEFAAWWESRKWD